MNLRNDIENKFILLNIHLLLVLKSINKFKVYLKCQDRQL